jgi:WD40 repeat protein
VTLEGHRKPVLTVAFHPAGNLIASGSGDNTVRLWGVKSET